MDGYERWPARSSEVPSERIYPGNRLHEKAPGTCHVDRDRRLGVRLLRSSDFLRRASPPPPFWEYTPPDHNILGVKLGEVSYGMDVLVLQSFSGSIAAGDTIACGAIAVGYAAASLTHGRMAIRWFGVCTTPTCKGTALAQVPPSNPGIS